MLKAKLTRGAIGLALIVSAVLAAVPAAQAAYINGLYTIQVIEPTRPQTGPIRDHRNLFVTAVSSSTTEPLRLRPWTSDPIQRQRAEWLLDQQSRSFDGKNYTAYILVNRYYGGCLSWIKPITGNGTRIGLAAYPQNCQSWPQRWILNNGSRWVTISDPDGIRGGFQVNLPVRTADVLCLDVTGFRHIAGNHLQVWGCTGDWNQTFFIRLTPAS